MSEFEVRYFGAVLCVMIIVFAIGLAAKIVQASNDRRRKEKAYLEVTTFSSVDREFVDPRP